MSSSTSNLDLLTQSQYGHYITVNGLADAASPAMLFGRRQALCSGLNWFYYGGVLLADGITTTVANNAAALVLTASATNYIEATTAGVVSANTVGFTAGRIPLYTVVTGASSVTSYTDQRPLTYQSATFTANIKTFLGTPSSANLAAAVTDETGSGALVFATSPTLTTPTINTAASVGGTWTAAATWTLPAHTLGGTVSGGGNQLNNVVIGTVTPLAGAFTTLTTSGRAAIGGAISTDRVAHVNGPITGATTAYSIVVNGVIQSDVTVAAHYNRSALNTLAAAFTVPLVSHYTAAQGTIGAGSAVTTQCGFIADASLTGATNNYGYRGSIPAGTNRYNCYMDGTAPNYFAGDMQCGKTVTAGGITGNRTIDKTVGSVNFAAGATSLVVTNSLVTVNSIILATVAGNDATIKSVQVVAAAGSFTLYANAAATAETRVNFIVIN
ncbi:MAG: hypothetical protein V5B31_02065 [Candidatus Accumulibacter propinquus]|jgi:hypothetical protein|uniref:hypothetical protein n=1 Tax=Candidatus Accumulibacter propinquus TaxID=2954380 RepID=UPI002FC3B21B